MSLVRRFGPSWRLPTLWDQMDQLMREMTRLIPWAEESGEPQTLGIPVDVYETDTEVVVKAELPGIKKEDIEINLQDNVLSIRAQSKEEQEVKEDKYYRREIRYGNFYRALSLPSEVDAEKVEATFENGVCTIRAPKVKEKVGRKIEVK